MILGKCAAFFFLFIKPIFLNRQIVGDVPRTFFYIFLCKKTHSPLHATDDKLSNLLKVVTT